MPAAKKTTPFQRLAAAMDELGPTAPKIKNNPGFRGAKYCPLPDLMEIVRGPLASNGLILTQGGFDTGRDGTIGVVTSIVDAESGDYLLNSHIAIPCDPSNPQKAIAAVTYARRTGITSILGIAEGDDDGNTAAAPSQTSRPTSDGGGKKDLW